MKVDKKIEEAFNVLGQIKEVKVSSSFKQKVLHQALEQNKEIFFNSWFTPKLQLVAMLVVLLVNVSVISYIFSSSTSEVNIDSFAQEYNLRTSNISLNN